MKRYPRFGSVSMNRGWSAESPSASQPPDGRVQVVLEIDEDAGRPEPALEILAGDHLTGLLEQGGEHLERLLAQPDANAALEEQAGGQVHREVAEAEDRGARSYGVGHDTRFLRLRCAGAYARRPDESNRPRRA